MGVKKNDWNQLRIVSKDGNIDAFVNGALRAGAIRCVPYKGFIGLSPVTIANKFRNIEIMELPPPKETGWTPLFNGKDLDGWVAENIRLKKREGDLAPGWTVKDNLLNSTGKRPWGWLMTKKSFEDYDLQLEFQFVNPTPDNGENQNIFVTVHDGPPPGDSGSSYFFSVDRHGLCKLSRTDAHPEKLQVQKQHKEILLGEWNMVEIRCRDKTIQVTLNGKDVGTLLKCDPAKGHIRLHPTGYLVNYRNIRIREARPEPAAPAFQPLFNGKDLDGWRSRSKDVWKWQDGRLVGTQLASGANAHVLWHDRTFKNFELEFDVRVKDGDAVGHGGVFVRSKLFPPDAMDPGPPVRGHRANIGGLRWGSLSPVGIGGDNVHSARAKTQEGDFNQYRIRCEGHHVKIEVNGITTVDKDIPDLPAEGIIAWQLGKDAAEITFKNIRIRELPSSEEAGWTKLFNGQDLDGWVGDLPRWTVADGELVGKRLKQAKGRAQLFTSKDYENYELRLDYRFGANLDKAPYAWVLVNGEDRKVDRSPVFSVTLKQDAPPVLVNAFGAKHGRGSSSAGNKPKDGWNQIRVVSQSGQLDLYFNGQHVATRPDCRPSKGYIALAINNDTDIYFRNIEIKELSPPKETGWAPLFNGKNLDGWVSRGDDANAWRVADGELVGPSEGGLESIQTKRTDYQNFHLRAEARIKGTAGGYLSFRTKDLIKGPITAALLHPEADRNGCLMLFAAFSNAKIERTPLKSVPDGWFTIEIIADGRKATVKINGITTSESTNLTVQDGAIGLSALKFSDIRIRKLEIKELNPSEFDLDRLQGFWIIEFAEQDGKPSDKLKGKVRIQGNTINFGADEKTFTLDASANPKRIDLIYPKSTQNGLGIYRFDGEGDRLILCIWDGKDRPTEFSTKGGENRKMMTLKRAPTP
jgi:uncharacterized protein (TIGR03067 family)